MPENKYELYHYGVLGMKWGIRRAKKQQANLRKKAKTARESADEWDEIASYRKASGKTKQSGEYSKYAKKDRIDAAKYEAKANRIGKNDAEIADKLYSKQSSAANKRIAEMSTGKAVAQAVLMGSYGALKYNEARAEGVSRGKAAVNAVLQNAANVYTGGLFSAAKYLENRSARKRG